MANQDTMANPQYPVGSFNTHEEAEAACNVLKNIGFPAEEISVTIQALDPNPPLQMTQAGRSATGGALAGGLLGSIVGFFMAMVIRETPGAGDVVPNLPPILTILAGGVIGTTAGGLIGVLAGTNVPKRYLSRCYLATR
jgi:hypothetical protein